MPHASKHASAQVIKLPIRSRQGLVITPADRAIARTTIDLWRGWMNLALAVQLTAATAACLWPLAWLNRDATGADAKRADEPCAEAKVCNLR